MDDMPFQHDMEQVAAADFIPWEKLQNKRVLVTGATGLIGYSLVSGLLFASRQKELGLQVVALVRDKGRALERFAEQLTTSGDLELLVGTVEQLPFVEGQVDYVIHGASQTASKAMVQQPVETIKTAICGTINLLELARTKASQGFVYLSSMEVYGHPPKGQKVTEKDVGALVPTNIRNSYPISKVQCESLCCAYASEYGVPAKCVRLAQTFGPGCNYNDNRVFAEFARCVIEKRDIVLKTKGETERSYLYTADAVTAILTVLLKGGPGEIYNAANEDTYCSIAEMAQKIAQNGGIQVKYELQDAAAAGYPDVVYMDMATGKLKTLGWRADSLYPGGGILTMFRILINDMAVSSRRNFGGIKKAR